MSESVREKYREQFLAVARQRLVAIVEALGRDDGAGATRAELHTLAGEAGMMGYVEVAEAARAAETLAESWRSSGDERARGRCARLVRGLPALLGHKPVGNTGEAPAPADDSSGKTLLLVEDSELVAEHLREAFEGSGYTVEVADDIEPALDAVSQLRPDIVVTDMRLPGGLGTALCQTLRAQGFARPIWLMSGDDGPELASAAADAGASGCVGKRDGVQHIVERVLAKQPA